MQVSNFIRKTDQSYKVDMIGQNVLKWLFFCMSAFVVPISDVCSFTVWELGGVINFPIFTSPVVSLSVASTLSLLCCVASLILEGARWFTRL